MAKVKWHFKEFKIDFQLIFTPLKDFQFFIEDSSEMMHMNLCGMKDMKSTVELIEKLDEKPRWRLHYYTTLLWHELWNVSKLWQKQFHEFSKLFMVMPKFIF